MSLEDGRMQGKQREERDQQLVLKSGSVRLSAAREAARKRL